jgi:hypothetical protein
MLINHATSACGNQECGQLVSSNRFVRKRVRATAGECVGVVRGDGACALHGTVPARGAR